MENNEYEHLGVATIVFGPSGSKVLLGKRLNGYASGTYGLPAGRLELAETTEFSANRELEEEAGITAHNLEFVGTVREFCDTYNFIHFVYKTNAYSGTIENREPQRCEGWDWYPLDDLPDMMPAHAMALELYKSKLPLYDSLAIMNPRSDQ